MVQQSVSLKSFNFFLNLFIYATFDNKRETKEENAKI